MSDQSKVGALGAASAPLDYIGFKKLRAGRIHLFCPACGRKMSNMPRDPGDPPTAVLAHVYCDCQQGNKDPGMSFFDAYGREVIS